jgi:hypothetical protein
MRVDLTSDHGEHHENQSIRSGSHFQRSLDGYGWITCKRCDSGDAPRLVFRMHKSCSSEEEEAELATRDVAEIPVELMKFPIDFPLEVLTEPEKCCLEDDLSIVIYSNYV